MSTGSCAEHPVGHPGLVHQGGCRQHLLRDLLWRGRSGHQRGRQLLVQGGSDRRGSGSRRTSGVRKRSRPPACSSTSVRDRLGQVVHQAPGRALPSTSSSARSVNSSPRITQVASIRRANWSACRWKIPEFLQQSRIAAGEPLGGKSDLIRSGGARQQLCGEFRGLGENEITAAAPHRSRGSAPRAERRAPVAVERDVRRRPATVAGLPSAGAARATPADFPRPPKCMSSKTRTCGPRAHSPTTYRRAWSNAFSAVIEASGMRTEPVADQGERCGVGQLVGTCPQHPNLSIHIGQRRGQHGGLAGSGRALEPQSAAPAAVEQFGSAPYHRDLVLPADQLVGGRGWWGGQPGQILLEAVRVHGHDPAVGVHRARDRDRCPTAPR